MRLTYRTPKGDQDVTVTLLSDDATVGDVAAAIGAASTGAVTDAVSTHAACTHAACTHAACTHLACTHLACADLACIDLACTDVAAAACDDVLVDGAATPATAPVELSRLRSGSVIAAGAAGPPPDPGIPPSAAEVEVAQIAGLEAGGRVVLAPGRHDFGPVAATGALGVGPVARPWFSLMVRPGAPTVVVPTAGQTVRVEGREITAPHTVTNAVIEAGTTRLRIAGTRMRDDAALPPPDRTGTLLFGRPPRRRAPGPPAPVAAPAPPDAPAPPPKLSVITMIAPAVLGVTMAIVMRQPFFLLFAGMTPLMVAGRWVDGRRTARKERRRHAQELQRAVARFRHDVAAARDTERARRQEASPHLGEVARRATSADPRLWERRVEHDDFLHLVAGYGSIPWRAGVDGATFAELDQVLADHAELADGPALVDLRAGRAVAIVGPRAPSLAVARSLLIQTATLHGPADVGLYLLTEPGRTAAWEWLKWLPHLAGDDGSRRVALTATDTSRLLEPLDTPADPAGPPRRITMTAGAPTLEPPVGLLVVDGGGHLAGRGAKARRLLAGKGADCRAIVLTERPEDVPAVCSVIVTVDGSGRATVAEPAAGRWLRDVVVVGASEPLATMVARSLAAFEDPEVAAATAGLPQRVALADLLDLPADNRAGAILGRWRANGPNPPLAATIGVGEHGRLAVDLVADGPHALLAGTTGSGKSELLRTTIASLACQLDPEHLNFVMVDFKGGGAFDACARLPHTVAVVTDLDDHLAARALRCLKAELRHREQLLRSAGASDLASYLTSPHDEPLPRLMVVVDEFATLAAELPDFLDSLVDIAQRGRSLGIHLVLATQRPSGVLDHKIRANTNLRIALRVQDEHDSLDVIGTSGAAALGRHQAGRGWVRLGAGEVLPFQAALVTTDTLDCEHQAAVSVLPFRLVDPAPDDALLAEAAPGAAAPLEAAPGRAALGQTANGTGATDLDRLVTAVQRSTERAGTRPPREIWPAPLPDDLDAAPLLAGAPQRAWATPMGLVDLPDQQRQDVWWWDAADGNCLVYGVNGADTTSALATVALGLAHRHAPDDVHLYVADFHAGVLAPLEDLPHTGAYVRADDAERTLRLLDLLEAILDRRRDEVARRRLAGIGPGAGFPLVVLVVDNYGGLTEALEESAPPDAVVRLGQLVRDGPALGLRTLATASHERAVPLRVASLIENKVVLRLADPNGYPTLGLRVRDLPDLVDGRAMHAATGRELQLARFAGGDLVSAVAAVDCTSASRRPAARVRALGTDVAFDDVAAATGAEDGTWKLALGLTADRLEPTGLLLPAGEHAVVTGPPGSGRSTVLCTLAAAAGRLRPRPRIVAVAPRRSPLRSAAAVDELIAPADAPGLLPHLVAEAHCLVLVDDAEALPAEAADALQQLAKERADSRHLVAAARPDELRSLQSWTQPLRASRSGVVLQPSQQDGDVFRTVLPLRGPQRFPAGRGFVVGLGLPEAVQVAVPPAAPRHSSDAPARPDRLDPAARARIPAQPWQSTGTGRAGGAGQSNGAGRPGEVAANATSVRRPAPP